MKFAGVAIAVVLLALAATSHAEQPAAAQGAQVERGRGLYRSACAACHGLRGDGRAPAANALSPKPRDFTQANYRWRSTRAGTLPLDEDIDRTLRHGVPGTTMPAWEEIFSASDRAALIAYLKTLSPAFGDEGRLPQAEDIVAQEPRRPFPASEESVAAGQGVYERMHCALCHGERGAGDGEGIKVLTDDVDEPIAPRDFRKGCFKSGEGEAGLYRTITTGPDGTEMLGYKDLLTDEERWQLVDYIRSLKEERSVLVQFLLERPGE